MAERDSATRRPAAAGAGMAGGEGLMAGGTISIGDSGERPSTPWGVRPPQQISTTRIPTPQIRVIHRLPTKIKPTTF